MKRILALDGGGIRGVFTLEVLVKIEEVLRDYYAKQDPEKAKTFVLRDHFDFLAGTSTGAIIASLLCWGMPVKKVKELYHREGKKMFAEWRKIKDKLSAKYDPGPISEFLQGLFKEKDGSQATLASPQLRNGEKENLLMVVVRNHTTGSAWPLTNNPLAMFNDPKLPDCNTQIPLWQLVRASTAAPYFFPPETITLGETKYVFVDGSITPYSNPALIAAMTAILPGYRVNWAPGPENIRVVSVGTISFSSEVPLGAPSLRLGVMIKQIPNAILQTLTALLQTTGWQQDYLCRCLGECIFAENLEGEKLDVEVGNLLAGSLLSTLPSGRSWFSYVRYNRTFRKKEMMKILEDNPGLKEIDAIHAIPRLSDIGQDYAEKNVKIEHLV
jgi:predicted acylesterase/phospholipase RssA